MAEENQDPKKKNAPPAPPPLTDAIYDDEALTIHEGAAELAETVKQMAEHFGVDPLTIEKELSARLTLLQVTSDQQAQAEAQAKAADAHDDTKVMVESPRAFTLVDARGKDVKFAAGVQSVDRDHAEHWYAKAHGVKVVKAD
jgi:hypothetical protein